MEKVVFVEATFKEIIENKTVKVPTGEKEKGIFGFEKDVTETKQISVSNGSSDKEIDGVQLAKDMQEAISSLNNDGYMVTTISPVTSGEYKYDFEAPTFNAGDRASYGWGYGFSYTEGMIILARKIK